MLDPVAGGLETFSNPERRTGADDGDLPVASVFLRFDKAGGPDCRLACSGFHGTDGVAGIVGPVDDPRDNAGDLFDSVLQRILINSHFRQGSGCSVLVGLAPVYR